MEGKTTPEQAELWGAHHFVLLMGGGAVGNYLWLPVGAVVLEFVPYCEGGAGAEFCGFSMQHAISTFNLIRELTPRKVSGLQV